MTLTPADVALHQALALWRRGLSVIPVPRPDSRHDGKCPATTATCAQARCHRVLGWTQYQTRLPTEAEIRDWFSGEPTNIAIVTGALSALVVVDADSPEALRWCTRHLPYTAWQVETARGFHLYYRHPGVRVANRARIETRDGRLAVDVRGDGGFVVAAGSIHGSGAEYLEAGDWSEPREHVPVFWPGWLSRPARPAAPPRIPRPTGDLVERARRYLAAIPPPVIGHGSDADVLYAACRLTRGFGLSEGDAIALLWAWAGGRPGWTPGWIAQKVRHAQRYGTEPIGALR